jgi:HAD superfamily hydrolase (TIGR01490 family)
VPAARRAALFDMDRTLIRKDSASLFVRYQRDIGEAGFGDMLKVAWWLTQYTLGVIDAERVALRALASYRGREEALMAESCQRWFRDYVLEHVCAAGRAAIARHREAGDLVAIVTSATPYAARPLARELGIELVVSSELEVDERGCFTGQIRKPLCYGPGKIVRTQRLAEREGFELGRAWFYSDSITDLPLLEHVERPVAVNPDPRLRRTAVRRGWPIERW